MSTRRFFCWSLCLPVAIVLGGLAMHWLKGLASLILVTSPVYVPLAFWACHRIKRATQLDDIVGITLMLPPLFAGILLVVFGVICWSIAGPAVGFIAAVMSVLVGYGFVMLSWTLYFLLRKARIVAPDLAWAP